ncbi:hypothetical protein CSA17_06295 [bacterium DOLJORAL78_65_58]|nr:MAG: hypothetical protein CSA17_06295 [bacterium DOLJORAL78_65_58]
MSTTATDTPRGLKMFPRAFWAANVMEIFERMGWYGFYAVSSLYLTEAVADGGLGFTSQDRGVIQGVVTFFLYLFPAAFGALADRYGYRAMFLASTMIMAPAYLLLQFPTSFWAFFAVYFLVAVGHGMFKPVVISTVALTTTEKTGSMGFGIFYMMVNVGGFLGPIIAGVVRGWSWTYVFCRQRPLLPDGAGRAGGAGHGKQVVGLQAHRAHQPGLDRVQHPDRPDPARNGAGRGAGPLATATHAGG